MSIAARAADSQFSALPTALCCLATSASTSSKFSLQHSATLQTGNLSGCCYQRPLASNGDIPSIKWGMNIPIILYCQAALPEKVSYVAYIYLNFVHDRNKNINCSGKTGHRLAQKNLNKY